MLAARLLFPAALHGSYAQGVHSGGCPGASPPLRLPAAAQGVHWATLWDNLNQQGSFSVGFIICILLVDVLLFSTLAWYLDKVGRWPHC